MFLLYLIIIIQSLIIIILLFNQHKTKKQIREAQDIVDDIESGNMERRIVIDERSIAAELCYSINTIIISMKSELSKTKQSEKAYRMLITSLSHDVRTPLASLMGHLEAINLGYVTAEEKKNYILIALNKANDLKLYIDTLFEWLKLESGERIYNFKKIDIYEYFRKILAEWIPVFDEKSIAYQINIPDISLHVYVEITAIKRIIENVLQNALIHSQAASISFNIQQKNDSINIDITDDGIGISPDNLPHIFDRLYKCNTARGVKGNGLGLSIVKELVNGLNGLLNVKSQEGLGTQFHIQLPIKK